MNNDENNVRPKKEPTGKAFLAISVVAIVPAVIAGYMIDKYFHDFFAIILIILPIMGICLWAYTYYSKTRLTFIDLLVLMSIVALLLSIVLPMRSDGCKSYLNLCKSNVHHLYLSLLSYADDHDNNWPTQDSWCASLLNEDEDIKYILKCHGDKQGLYSYAINSEVLKLKPNDLPSNIVVLFESIPGGYQTGGSDLLTTENHQNRGCVVVFGDGHVEFVLKDKIENLKWKLE
ncbi:MAG: hypothetical protein ACYSUS_09030 [Planctomycetota bacterium]|jgi:prepilin-type processing-associated H-X9-DG protein